MKDPKLSEDLLAFFVEELGNREFGVAREITAQLFQSGQALLNILPALREL